MVLDNIERENVRINCDVCQEGYPIDEYNREHLHHDRVNVRNIAVPVVRNMKRELSSRVQQLREEERLCRKNEDEENAEEYRRAANAMEDALAELEGFTEANHE